MQRFAPDWHCDLMEQLSDYRACASMSLDDIALAIGLPGKIGGHGSEVEAMLQRGEIVQSFSFEVFLSRSSPSSESMAANRLNSASSRSVSLDRVVLDTGNTNAFEIENISSTPECEPDPCIFLVDNSR